MLQGTTSLCALNVIVTFTAKVHDSFSSLCFQTTAVAHDSLPPHCPLSLPLLLFSSFLPSPQDPVEGIKRAFIDTSGPCVLPLSALVAPAELEHCTAARQGVFCVGEKEELSTRGCLSGY